MKSINFFDETKNQPIYRALVHEIGHAWSMYVTNHLPSGTKINYLSHFWDGLQTFEKYDGLMQDNHIIDNKDGTYSVIHYDEDHLSKFHPFALYLMGLETPDNIKEDFLLIKDMSHYTSGPYYENGIRVGSQETYTSPVEKVRISEFIIAAGEPRNPNFATSQKDFTIAYILVTKKSTQPTVAQMKKIKYIRDTLPKKWNEATLGKSNILQTQ